MTKSVKKYDITNIMYELGRRIKLVYQYPYQLGFWQTFRFFLNVYTKSSTQKYHTRNCNFFVHVRGKTTDKDVFQQIFIQEDYNLHFTFVSKIVNIIDAGANCGYAALYFKSKYPDARIICIEPELTNIKILELNVSYIKDIEILKAGLRYKSQNLKIINTADEKWGFRVIEDEKGSIIGVPIDYIISYYKMDTIDILKIDIEGSEKLIFERYTDKWINHVRKIVIEPHDNFIEGCEQAIKNIANKEKFDIRHKGENRILEK